MTSVTFNPTDLDPAAGVVDTVREVVLDTEQAQEMRTPQAVEKRRLADLHTPYRFDS